MIRAETPAELAERAAAAADWGHCLDCGADVDALAGEVLCAPCDAAAEAWELEHGAEQAELAQLILAEVASYGPHWSPRWSPAPQGELAL